MKQVTSMFVRLAKLQRALYFMSGLFLEILEVPIHFPRTPAEVIC